MKAQNKILELFRRNPHAELSTSEIIKSVEKSVYETIENILKDEYADKEKIRHAKRIKAQLHRKILYHLNELIKKGILRVSKEGSKGKKYFSLDLEDGEELTVEKFKKSSIKISKPVAEPAVPIEGYEQKGVVHRLEPSTWIERLNSVLVDCKMFKDLKELGHFVNTCFSNVNDVIALNDFESVFESNDIGQVIDFIRRLNSRCGDYGKKICCIFDLSDLKKEDDIVRFMRDYSCIKDKSVSFVFDTRVREFQDKALFFEKLIKVLGRSDVQLYIKNQDLHEAPYFLGRAGSYAFDEDEWKTYKKELQRKVKCLVCAHATVMVDASRFFENEGKNIEKFKDFNLKIADALLNANSIQRRRMEELFSDLIKLDEEHIKDIFIFSKNYIRFWNYGWKVEDFDQEFLIELFKRSKQAVDKFCISEETIYKSCGMPTRFRIAFSYACEDVAKGLFNDPRYKKFSINGLKDFYREDVKGILETKEKLFDLFDGGDVITFYREGEFNTRDVIREISFILNSYKIPFFRWNFHGVEGNDLSLRKFIK